MNWAESLSVTCYASYIDSTTWHDTGRFEITGGTITRNANDLQQSATINCVNFPQDEERWVRIYMNARQKDETVRVPLFTGLSSSPARDINGKLETMAVDCYSVLKPAGDILLDLGWYVRAGANGAEATAELLSVTPAPITFAGNAPYLQSAIVAEENETCLSMAQKILKAINWRFRINGNGEISIEPKASEPMASYDAIDNDSIEPILKVAHDWYGCPNVFRAIARGLSATAKDESDSILSIPKRGREIWAQESSCDLNDGETLAEYAQRRLKEAQQVATTVEYTRRFNPDVYERDLVYLHYPAQNIIGMYQVASQSIKLEEAGHTSEEVVYVR